MSRYRVTCIPGDGIGPEIMAAAKTALAATQVNIGWVDVEAGADAMDKCGTPLPDSVIESVRDTKVALKGPVTTPIGSGFRSVNVGLRKALDLYANLRPAVSIPGVRTRYEGVDLVVVRENTEDLYAGIEHMAGEDAAESIKLITRKGCERIARFAFDYARREGRRKVTAVHKANIMKLTDGLFLEVCRQTAAGYPEIEFEDRIVDNMCMQLVQKPELYDVLLCPNLYGDILSDLCAGLVGGLGVAPGANIGLEMAVFEPVHGSAPKYAGKDKADPTALILSAVLMLSHLGEVDAAHALFEGVRRVIGSGKRVTYDLGGSSGTKDMGEAIAEEVARLVS
ncbi:MAG: isocitrate/isopropylmalate dehydrogenase family protein [Actinobacteria bacterium]|nr:isocitrate/isopropylmalate dehydrogenase family protein [Actinomycetota bacterium]